MTNLEAEGGAVGRSVDFHHSDVNSLTRSHSLIDASWMNAR